MILTTSLINTTVLRAFCALGAKAIKYYGGLAIGKNNTCLFREMTLLRVYIDILKNFKIVGSEISCCCEIEGDYDTLLNNLSNATESPIQFNCDGTGYMIFIGDPYTFTYSYDEVHKVMVIKFDIPSISYTSYFDVVDPGINKYYEFKLDGVVVYSNTSTTFDDFIDDFNLTNQLGYTLVDTGTSIVITSEFGFVREDISITQGTSEIFIEETIIIGDDITETFNYVSFSEACSLRSSLNSPFQPISPLKVATLDITGVGLQNEDYTITILDQFGNLITTQTFSGDYLIDPDAVALQWNIQYGYANNWLMTYNGSEYVFTSPFTGINYEGYQISFSQTEDVAVPGIKASATGVVNFVEFNNLFNNYVNSTLLGGTTAGISSTPNSIALGLGGAIVALGLGYTYSVTGNVITLYAPTVGTSFNGLPYQIERIVSQIVNTVTFCIITSSANGDTITITVNTDSGPVVIGTYVATNIDAPFKVALELTISINTGGTGFTAVQDNSCITISPPSGSGNTYVGDTVNADKTGTVRIEPNIQTFPGNVPASESVISFDLFEGGQDPNLGPSVITYNSVFEEVGSTTPFVNRNPCITRCHETSINITGTATEYYNDLIILSILNPLGNPEYSAAYPITMTLQEIVDAWNADPNTVLYPATLDGTVISFKSCLPLFDAYPYKAELVQYENGTNAATILLINSSVLPSSGPFVVSNSLNGTVYNSTTSFNTIEEFIDDFNDLNTGDFNATYVGPETSPNPPPVYSNALLTINEPFGSLDGLLLKLEASIFNGSTYGPPVLIGSYTVQAGDTNSIIATGLRNGVNNANIFQGTAITPPPFTGDLVLTVNDNATLPSQQEDYNGNVLALYKTVPNGFASTTLKIATAFVPAVLQIGVLSTPSVSFPTYNILNTDTSEDIVDAYVNIINTSGTGFTAYNIGSGIPPYAYLLIEAPNPGSYFNNTGLSISATAISITSLSTPTFTFQGGTDTEIGIDFTLFSGGENPGPLEPTGNSFVEFSVTGEEYNTIDLTYDYNSGAYIDTNTLSGAVNATREEYINNFTLCEEQPGSCMSTTVTQTCLSNDDVKKVITNINKIIK
jgi:hypothetical protein